MMEQTIIDMHHDKMIMSTSLHLITSIALLLLALLIWVSADRAECKRELKKLKQRNPPPPPRRSCKYAEEVAEEYHEQIL